jgi:hypothetical protein
MRLKLLIRIKEIVVEKHIQILQKAVSEYRKRYGHNPSCLGDLVEAKLITTIPQEPFGGRYYLDRDSLMVRSTELKRRLKLSID